MRKTAQNKCDQTVMREVITLLAFNHAMEEGFVCLVDEGILSLTVEILKQTVWPRQVQMYNSSLVLVI